MATDHRSIFVRDLVNGSSDASEPIRLLDDQPIKLGVRTNNGTTRTHIGKEVVESIQRFPINNNNKCGDDRCQKTKSLSHTRSVNMN